MNEKISIIVPEYNAAKTILRCIQSLISQTYRNLEIILVDDASTDGTGELLLEIEKTDPDRIMVILNDENRGPGGARNIGISYASGDYIGFVDADDYVHTEMYEKLLSELVRGRYDFVDCGYFDENNDRAMLHTGRDLRGTLNDHMRNELVASGGYLWSKLFKRSMFTEYEIIFREKCILEDSEIITQMIANASSVGAVEETLYWYSSSKDSLSKMSNADSYIDNICMAMQALYDLHGKISNYESLTSGIEYEIIQMYDYGVVTALKDAQDDKKLKTAETLERLRNIRKNTVSGRYRDNKYVVNKISNEDLKLMEDNDVDPVRLAHRFMK